MITYQFDQCFNDKNVIDECGRENRIVAKPFPGQLSGAKDPELVRALVAMGNPFVSIDGVFLDDNHPHIPDSHPGFVIVRFSYKVINRQLTSRAAARILHEFKLHAPNWFESTIRNSIVIITERTVEVYHVEDRRPIRDWGGRYKRCRDDGEESDWLHYDIPTGEELVRSLLIRLQTNESRTARRIANATPEGAVSPDGI